MLLIVKNEIWFQLLSRARFSIFVRSSLKALSLCQEIIRKNLLCKPSTWNMSKPHQGQWLPVWSVITAKLTQSHHHRSVLTEFWFTDMMSTLLWWDCCFYLCSWWWAPVSIHKCPTSLKLVMLFFSPRSLHHMREQLLSLCRCWWELGNQCTQAGIRGTWFG